MYGMVGRLAARLEDLYEAPRVPPGRLNRTDKVLRGEVIRAGARHQQPVRCEESEGELVQLAVCGLTLRDVLLALDESRRIENNHIVALTLLLQRFQGLKRIGTHRLERQAVCCGIASGKIQRRLGRIDAACASCTVMQRRDGPCSDV